MRIIDEQNKRITFNKFIFCSIKSDEPDDYNKIEWNILNNSNRSSDERWMNESRLVSHYLYNVVWKRKNLYLTNEEEVGGFPSLSFKKKK
jgi:hypothetical protein